MGDQESFATDRIDIGTFQLIPRRKAHRVDDAVQAIPLFAQLGKSVGDFVVVADIHGQHDLRTEILGEAGNPVRQFLTLVGEGQFGTLAMHRGSDAIGNGAVARDTNNQCLFVS